MLASLACAPRRLACRYWAGRVALRENRARQHLPAGPRRSEVAVCAEVRRCDSVLGSGGGHERRLAMNDVHGWFSDNKLWIEFIIATVVLWLLMMTAVSVFD